MMKEKNKDKENPCSRMTLIFDLDGFSIKEFTWKPGNCTLRYKAV